MERIYKYFGAVMLFAGCVLSFSCKKSFLEVIPKGKLVAQNLEDYSQLLNSLDLVNIGTTAQVPMGDEVAAVDPYFTGSDLKTLRLFRWDPVIYQPDEDASELAVPLQNIYVFNKVINETPAALNGSDTQKRSVIAEARAMRAWTYFLLINYFGKPYDSTSAISDPGFPIVTEADVTATHFTRATVKEVYDFILSDLVAAKPDLPATTTYRLRMARAAGEGLLGKVYMFMGRFNDALPMLNASITDLGNSTFTIGLYDYNVAFAAGGVFQPISIFGPTYPTIVNNQENVFGKQASNNWSFFNNELVLTPQAVSLYGATDLRLGFFSTAALFGPDYPNGMLRRVGPGTIQYGVIVPELYLLRAECKARLNDLPGAIADLETLRTKRMPAADAAVPGSVASQKLSLLKFVFDERIREFAMMGFRWFDMRRLSVDPLFGSSTYTHTFYSETGAVTSTYTLPAERLVLRLPPKILAQNPGMQDNP